MRIISFCKLLLVASLMLYLGSCDGSKKLPSDLDDAIFDNFEEIKLCKVTDSKNLDLPVIKLQACFRGKFEDSRGFNDFQIISQNQKDYYLIAKGTREGSLAQFATELVEKDGELVLQDFDRLYYTCIARYCDACAFKYSNNGTIAGCNCAEEKEDKPTGYAACEHTIGIKTSEKE